MLNGQAPSTDEEDTPIEAAWERIENWLMENAPMTLLTLNAGATDRDFWACEAALGFPLPAEVRESYRIHNGQAEGMLIAEAQLLPLADIAAHWQKCTAEITFWNPKWLPLAVDNRNDYICFDLSAPVNPPVGTIVAVRHDKEGFEVLVASFTEWLQTFIKWLEAGYYQWSEDGDGLVIL